MKRSICLGIGVLIGMVWVAAFAAQQPGELSPVISHVLAKGKNNNIPPAFARALGLSTNQPAPGKAIIEQTSTETNAFWASLQNTNAAVITTRKGNLSWYYVTDASGQLRRAMVNDANIYHGGGTNLSVAKEGERFEAQKRKWLDKYGQE